MDLAGCYHHRSLWASYDIVAIPIGFPFVATHISRPLALLLWFVVPLLALGLAIRVSLTRQFRYAALLLIVPVASSIFSSGRSRGTL
jgi:hypothetical protein